jgi:triacylglycerol esterase/lipase EstA (alpha/beta hydrolase family)
MTRTTRPARLRLAALGATLAAGALAVSTAAPAQAAELPEGGLTESLANYAAAPSTVRGANDFTCKPSAEHPNPVVLVPGTFTNMGASFIKMAPRLKNAGYCVYSLNYGMTLASFGRAGGLGPIKDSAKQLAAFVAKVRASTGAAKVDIVGHSQGGSVPMWWMKKMGGASQVAHYVGWAPSSHGTSLSGVVNLGHALNVMGFVTGLAAFGQFPGAIDQTYSSQYTKDLWADGNRVPSGPKYTVVMTKYDKVVTPYQTQSLEGDDVNNVLLQERCPTNQTGHTFMYLDHPTLQLTMNALQDGPKSFRPTCTGFSPVPQL